MDLWPINKSFGGGNKEHSGLGLFEYMQEELFIPLSMEETFFGAWQQTDPGRYTPC